MPPAAGPARDALEFRFPDDAELRERLGVSRNLVSGVRWRMPDGAVGTWESRVARRRGYVEVAGGGVVARVRTGPAATARLVRGNAVAAVAFVLGGALFTVGALLAQLSPASGSTVDVVYLVGGVFFSLGGYASVVLALNEPRGVVDGELVASGWRWWGYEPLRPGWVSAFVLFAGTLAFFTSLARAFLTNLTAVQQDRELWAPEMIGCVLFLVSGQVAVAEVCHRWFGWLPRSLGWWVVVVNQLGSALFLVSGIAGFVRHGTGDVISDAVVNWGTALGAACFSVAGVLQLWERPTAGREE